MTEPEDQRRFLTEVVTQWIVQGDLTPEIDVDQAVSVMLGAFERSKARVARPIALTWWTDLFYTVMMENDAQARFSYLRAEKPTRKDIN